MKYILIFTFALLATIPANAHSPYLKKQGAIKDPNGNPLILEKLYGDGIFTADPVSFQLRNYKGAVIAYTPTGSHVATYCPKINFCWAFPHSSISLFSMGYKLDPAEVNWNADPEKLDLGEKDKNAFEGYLKDRKQKGSRSYDFGYPEEREGGKAFLDSKISVIISPIFIICNHIAPLIAVALLSWLFVFFNWLFFKRFQPKSNANKILLRGLGFVIILAYCAAYFLVLFCIAFTIGTPSPYMLLVLLLSFSLAYKRIGKKKENNVTH